MSSSSPGSGAQGPRSSRPRLGRHRYSYYFLPPAGFRIEDPDDWIAFITFIVTAVVAGELASRAERRTEEAESGRREIERLYRELQAAFDRASEVEAARRNEQLRATLLEALTHNLRTPLTSIKASVTALLGAGGWGGGADLAPEVRRELLQVIDEESDRLNRFIEGLSTTDPGDRAEPLHLRAVPLAEIAAQALHRAETLTRDHRVDVGIAADLPLLSVEARRRARCCTSCSTTRASTPRAAPASRSGPRVGQTSDTCASRCPTRGLGFHPTWRSVSSRSSSGSLVASRLTIAAAVSGWGC